MLGYEPKQQVSTLPMGAVTGIGSLPFINAREAVQFVAQNCPDIPFWPQLPRRSPREQMIEQPLERILQQLLPNDRQYGYLIEEGHLDDVIHLFTKLDGSLLKPQAEGFFAFQEALVDGVFRRAIAIKAQMVGPVTLASQIMYRGSSLVEYPHALAVIGEYVARMAFWQIERLQGWGKDVIFFLDEPCLGMLSLEHYGQTVTSMSPLGVLMNIVKTIRQAGVQVGLHCCATPKMNVPTTAMCRIAPDILSFDAHACIEQFFADPHAQHFIDAGGIVAFGLVPTWIDLSNVQADVLFERWQRGALDIGDAGKLASHSMITASCGLGLSDESSTRRSFAIATQVADRIRNLALANG